MNKME